MVETEVGEALKPRHGKDRVPKSDFLSAERKARKNFELAGEMRVLVEDLPDLDEIAPKDYQRCGSRERRNK
jgi:hypothetical protein